MISLLKLTNWFMKRFLFILAVFINPFGAFAQSTFDSASASALAQSTNFSLPSSVAFNLLDVNPSQVYRPGFAKDFKFDWVIKDNKIVSNIAIEMQPAWLFFYKNTDYTRLLQHNFFQKTLSSLTISVGTAAKDSIRSLAWGVKANLYTGKNPIYDTAYINRIGNFEANKQITAERDSLKFLYDFETDKIKKAALEIAIEQLIQQYAKDSMAHFAAIDKYKEQYEKDNWNVTMVDVGYGRIYNYFSESIDSLSFISNGSGVWLSGNFGIGKKILINGMVKYTKIKNIDITTAGANIRYGGLNGNFFIEGLYNYSSDNGQKKITIAYGGEFKIRKIIALQVGLRTDYSRDLKFRNLIPIVNFNYLLGQ